jgi:hypothetical protein
MLLLLVAPFAAPACLTPVAAADLGIAPADGSARTARLHARRVERLVPAGCPDGTSCYPLYGAYGPYGGYAYWTAYTGPYRGPYR